MSRSARNFTASSRSCAFIAASGPRATASSSRFSPVLRRSGRLEVRIDDASRQRFWRMAERMFPSAIRAASSAFWVWSCASSALFIAASTRTWATVAVARIAAAARVETAARLGCLRANLQSRPAGPILRARTGSVARNRPRSSASSAAVS